MKSTAYFREQVLRKRQYLRSEWIEEIITKPLKREKQSDGRIRYWGVAAGLPGKVLRVITLEDGETVHNAFPDRSFKPPGGKRD